MAISLSPRPGRARALANIPRRTIRAKTRHCRHLSMVRVAAHGKSRTSLIRRSHRGQWTRAVRRPRIAPIMPRFHDNLQGRVRAKEARQPPLGFSLMLRRRRRRCFSNLQCSTAVHAPVNHAGSGTGLAAKVSTCALRLPPQICSCSASRTVRAVAAAAFSLRRSAPRLIGEIAPTCCVHRNPIRGPPAASRCSKCTTGSRRKCLRIRRGRPPQAPPTSLRVLTPI